MACADSKWYLPRLLLVRARAVQFSQEISAELNEAIFGMLICRYNSDNATRNSLAV